MNVLVIGSGGREHAVIRKLRESPHIDKIYAMPGNGGISREAVCLGGAPTDSAAAVQHCKNNNIAFVVVAPDDPLVKGAADDLRKAGFSVFGPSAKAAQIEGSKIFAKQLMKKYNIPTANYKEFDNAEKAFLFLEKAKFPLVIKADGLALGKGVVIAQNFLEAKETVNNMMIKNIFGESGKQIIIEEFLEGIEVTVLAFTDSKTIIPLPPSMDHKRAFDGNKGLNTGGMGVIAPNPFYTEKTAALCMETIMLPTINALNNEGCPFKGCLYFGLMLVKKDNGQPETNHDYIPYVIEYNCRFGDPEAQTVLPLLETDLFEIMQAVENEALSNIKVKINNKYACTIMLCSDGYPVSYEKGFIINGIENIKEKDTFIFHSGTLLDEKNNFITNGGRVLGVTAVRDTLKKAVEAGYQAVQQINFKNMFYRKDIGSSAL